MNKLQGLQAERSLAEQHHCEIGKMQASAARIVGTHINSPLRINRTRTLGLNLLPTWVVADSLRRSKESRFINTRQLCAHLTDELPNESKGEIDTNITGVAALPVGKTALRRISLKVSSDTIKQEQDALIRSLEEITNVDSAYRPFGLHYLNLVTTDDEHQSEVIESLEAKLPETLAFDRLKVVRRAIPNIRDGQRTVA